VLLGAVALRAANPGSLELVNLKVFDLYQQLTPRVYQPTLPGSGFPMPVKVVDLDDESLRRHGQWPWPRTLIAELIRQLQEAGAAAIAFDIVFAEPDRTSPGRVIEHWPATPEFEGLRAQIDSLPDHDEILAETMGQASVVTGFILTSGTGGGRPTAKAGIAHVGDNPLDDAPGFSGAVTSLPDLEAAARGNGSLNIDPDDDQIVRRVPLVLRYQGKLYPSLVAEALRVAQGAGSIVVKASGASGTTAYGAHSGISEIKIGGLVAPTDKHGRLWIYHTGPDPRRVVPAWRALAGDFEPAELRGKIVFVGASAAALNDLRPTPVHPATAGVEVHAQAAEQIISQTFLERPDWADGAEVLGLLGVGMVLIYTVFRLGAAWGATLALTSIAGGIGYSLTLFQDQRLLFSPLYPSITILMVLISASVTSYLHSEAGRRQVRTAFGRYMSPLLLERLAKNPHQLELGGEMRDMTVLFCDVRDFTTLSEKLDAQALTSFLNRFLTPMTEAVHETGGMVDKYMGDCVMAFWNAPLDDPDHARHACETALSMLRRIEELNRSPLTAPAGTTRAGTTGACTTGADKSNGEAPPAPGAALRVGIGISTGPCCVGNMGSEQRFDYSALGDTVNVASRLEGQTRAYGTSIIIGEATRAQARDLAALELDLLRVKGRSEPIRIFALVGDAARAESPSFKALEEAHEIMLSAYRVQNWAIARRQLEAAQRAAAGLGLEPLYGLYAARIEVFESKPPGPGWDGVFVARQK
ncbi:MAG: adenylate/guanylate cyclase domain-containing protein, partial [Rhodospirillales bacterium]|nr:adenylate/guanylate cyclase domain-containing protein [Rhodospirillales bacterium]